MAETFLCFSMHKLPDEALLRNNVSYRKLWNYQFQVLNRNGNLGKPKKGFVVEPGTPLLVTINGALALLPLDKYITSNDVPYALAYNFVPRLGGEEYKNYCVVSEFYGFSILTLPEHDWKRAMGLASKSPAEALLYSDRCLLALANNASEISASAEKAYMRFAKLRNLYIDQVDTHEGRLAANRAMEQALKCKLALVGENVA
jgi:hypothetical protein